MKTRILFGFIFALFFIENAYAGTNTWTGAHSVNWSDAANWSSGTPVAGDDIIIPGGTPFAPTVDIAYTIKSLTTSSTLTLTLSAALTVNKTFDITAGTTTFAGTKSATFGTAATIDSLATLIIGSSNTLTFNGNLSITATAAFVNNGIANINQALIGQGSTSPTTNNGTITVTAAAINLKAGSALTNNGTITTSAGSTIKLQANFATIDNNLNAVFTTTSTAVTLDANSTFTNTGGTVTMTSSTFAFNGNGSIFINQNSGATTGIFNLSATAVTFNKNNQIKNFGTTTANNGTTITTVTTNTCKLNNYGTFYAGTSNSPCTITGSLASTLLIDNATTTVGATTYNGVFYLGSTSIIYPLDPTTSISNCNNCTFTLQSDIYGSASIGAMGGTISGTYNVQRYLTGGSSTYRSYRELSSPVYKSTVSGNNVYSLKYVKSSALLTGSGGVGGGFDKSGNPTLYLYRDNTAFTNGSFTGGNFRGVANMSADPSYSIDNDGSGYNVPVGNGFLFFDRGDRTTNLANKYSPGTSAESITLTATGTVNTGPITVVPWFSLLPTLDYTSVAGNAAVLGFAMVGNPYPSSIDWDTFSSTTSTNGVYGPNVSQFAYVLDPASKNYNVYKQGNAGVGTLAASGSNIIPSGQGFFVQALATGASLTFNEAGKTSAQATPVIGNLFLGTPPVASVNQYLHLKLVQDSINTDGVIINFAGQAKKNFVLGEDAMYKPGSGSVSLSCMSADNIALAYSSQSLPKLSPLVIPLNVNATADGTYKLKMDAVKSIPDIYQIWLKDAVEKDSLDIKHNQSYAFTITKSDTTTYGSNRFSLVVREDPAKMLHMLNFYATKNYNSAQVVWTTENEQNYTNFTVERSTDGGTTFNVVGGYASSALGTYSLLDKTPRTGANMYRLKTEDLNGTIAYSNIVTLSFSDSNILTKGEISIYPNPSADMINLSVNTAGGAQITGTSDLQRLALSPALATGQSNQQVYDIKIINVTGAVIKTATTASPNWQDNVSTLTPGTYIIQVINNKDKTMVGKTTFVKM